MSSGALPLLGTCSDSCMAACERANAEQSGGGAMAIILVTVLVVLLVVDASIAALAIYSVGLSHRHVPPKRLLPSTSAG